MHGTVDIVKLRLSQNRDAIQSIKRIDSRRVDSTLIIIIREMLGREWEVELSYVPREFNTVADKITSTMCGKPIGEVSFEVMPSLVSMIVATEASLGCNMHEDPGG
ncbi:hypothetical protein V6N13_020615 [Hibiscus sabdariffa]